MLDSKLEERKTNYRKINYGLVEARESHKLSLRKERIETIINDKRDISKFFTEIDKTEFEIQPSQLLIEKNLLETQFNSMEELLTTVRNYVGSNDLELIKLGVYFFRTTLAKSTDMPLDYINQLGICDLLMDTVEKYMTIPQLVYEILWSFTNISCLTENPVYMMVLMQDDYIKNYLVIFDTYKTQILIMEQLIWAMGNILTSCKEARLAMVKYKLIDKVISILKTNIINEKIAKIGIWMLSSLVKFKELDNAKVAEITDLFITYIRTEDVEILSDILWGVSYLSDTENIQIINLLVCSKFCGIIYSLNIERRENLITPIVRITGNLLSNDNHISDNLIDQGCLGFLQKHITHKSNLIRREIIWAISNIAAGTLSQINALLEHNIVPILMAQIQNSDFEIVKEIVWVLGNIINGGNFAISLKLLDIGAIDTLLEVLDNFKDAPILIITLNTIERLLNIGKINQLFEEYNPFIKYVIEKGGLERIESLINFKVENISGAAEEIIEKYFNSRI